MYITTLFIKRLGPTTKNKQHRYNIFFLKKKKKKNPTVKKRKLYKKFLQKKRHTPPLTSKTQHFLFLSQIYDHLLHEKGIALLQGLEVRNSQISQLLAALLLP